MRAYALGALRARHPFRKEVLIKHIFKFKNETVVGQSEEVSTYVRRVQGTQAAHWAAWFAGLTMTVADDGTTTLASPLVDQASLHGVLRTIRDLGRIIISVKRQRERTDEQEEHL